MKKSAQSHKERSCDRFFLGIQGEKRCKNGYPGDRADESNGLELHKIDVVSVCHGKGPVEEEGLHAAACG